LLGIAVVVIVAAVAGYFFFTAPSGSNSKSITLTLSEVKEGEEGWVPSTIYLNKGDIVQLTVVNNDDEFTHSLAAPELEIQTEMIPPINGRLNLQFTADRTGTFLFNDPTSAPDCKQAPPEEVSRRDMTKILERLAGNLGETQSIDQVKPYVDQLKTVAETYKQIFPNDITAIITDLEKTATMDDVANLTSNLTDAVEALRESLSPPCIPPGQIIVEP
jgi:hypothetical protein